MTFPVRSCSARQLCRTLWKLAATTPPGCPSSVQTSTRITALTDLVAEPDPVHQRLGALHPDGAHAVQVAPVLRPQPRLHRAAPRSQQALELPPRQDPVRRHARRRPRRGQLFWQRGSQLARVSRPGGQGGGGGLAAALLRSLQVSPHQGLLQRVRQHLVVAEREQAVEQPGAQAGGGGGRPGAAAGVLGGAGRRLVPREVERPVGSHQRAQLLVVHVGDERLGLRGEGERGDGGRGRDAQRA